MGGEWQSLGGTFSSAPYAVAEGSSILVFAADAQSALAWCRWDGGSWTSWQSLGGILMSPPIANLHSELTVGSGVYGRPVRVNLGLIGSRWGSVFYPYPLRQRGSQTH
jgi:hypothetical protein